MTEAPRKKIVDGQPHDRAVRNAHERHGDIVQRTAEVDGWHLGAQHRVGHAPVVDAGQDSVPPPGGEPGRRGSAQAVRFEIKGPRAVLLLVADHAAQNPPPVFARGFNEQGDPGLEHAGYSSRPLTEKQYFFG